MEYVMTDLIGKFEKIKGVVSCIYEDFDTLESIVKSRAVAFGLDVIGDDGNDINGGSGGNEGNSGNEGSGGNEDNDGIVIVVYDRNAVKLGLIKVGGHLTCFGKYSGRIAAVSNGNVVEGKLFLCMGIMGDADINEEELMKQGGIRLR
jgi:hypothetical protein